MNHNEEGKELRVDKLKEKLSLGSERKRSLTKCSTLLKQRSRVLVIRHAITLEKALYKRAVITCGIKGK